MNFVDHEELADRSRRQRRKQKRDLVWNVLTGIAVIATITLVGILMLIFSNPRIGLNPFPPPTMPVLVDLSTPTATLVFLPPTWTPTARLPESSSDCGNFNPHALRHRNPVTSHHCPHIGRRVYTRSSWKAPPSPWRARYSTPMAIAAGRVWPAGWWI